MAPSAPDADDGADGMRRFTRNSAYGTVAGLLVSLSSVGANILVAHLLGVELTGVVALALWVAAVAAAVADLGVQLTIARYLPELTATGRTEEAQQLADVMLLWLIGSCLAVLCVFAGYAIWAESLESGRGHALLWLLVGVTCVFQTLGGFTYGLLRGLQRFDRLAAVTSIAMVCQLAGIGLGSVAFGALGAVAGCCIGSLLPAVLAFRYARPGRRAAPELRARVRRYAAYTWAASLSSTFVWSRAEIFFLHRSSGSAAVGLFTVGISLASVATQGALLLTAGLLPYFTESFGRGAPEEMKSGYETATRVLAFLMMPVSFGMAAILPSAMPLLFGEAFAGAVPAATVMVLAAGAVAVSSVGNSVVMAMDRSDLILASGLVAAVLAIIAGFTVIPAFGLMGAAWARAGIQLTAVALGNWFVFSRLGFRLPLAGLAKLTAAAALCGLAAHVVLDLETGAAALAPAIIVGALTYAVAVKLLRALHPDDAARLSGICGRLPRRWRIVAEATLRLLAAPSAIAPVPARGGSDAG